MFMSKDEPVVRQSETMSRDQWNSSLIADWPLFRLCVQFAVTLGCLSVLSIVSACELEGDDPSVLSGGDDGGAAGFLASVQTAWLGRSCEPPEWECGPDLSCGPPGVECGPELSCSIVDNWGGGECVPFGVVGLKHDCGPSDPCMWGATCFGVCYELTLWGSDSSGPRHCREFGAWVPSVNYPLFCNSRCDPFAPYDCDGSCLTEWNGEFDQGFYCSMLPGQLLGETCDFVNDLCGTGLVCAYPEELGDFCAATDSGCCTKVCDLSLPDPNGACLGLGEADTCVPIFDDPVDEWEARLGKCVAVT
jgi:hypothetical protein